MSLKHALKSHICLTRMTPNYPLAELIDWLDCQNISRADLLRHLDDIQNELDVEAEALRRYGTSGSRHEVLHGYWCLYCTQVRAYYRSQLKHPEHEQALRF